MDFIRFASSLSLFLNLIFLGSILQVMAKKETVKTETKIKGNKKPGFLRDQRFRAMLGFTFILTSIYLFLALVSFVFTWKIDQSFEWAKLFSDSEVTASNWAGKAGAIAANLFMNKWFGLAGFVVPFMLFMIGQRLLKLKILPFGRSMRIALFSAILLSLILGFVFGSGDGFLGSGPGGGHGFFITRWSNALLGKLGTGLVLLVGSLTFLVFAFDGFWEWLKNLFIKKPETAEEADPGFIAAEAKKETEESIVHNEDIITLVEGESVSKIFESTDGLEISRPEEPAYTPIELDEEELFAATLINDEQITETLNSDDFEDESEQKAAQLLKELGPYDPYKELPWYMFPKIEFLEDHKTGNTAVTNDELIANKNKIVKTLQNYKIEIEKIHATIGPTVTLYEIIPAPGIKISKIKSLEDDIALSLAALGIRIIAPIPGKGTIGIEVPNQQPEIVSMRSIITSKKFQETKFDLPIALGKTIQNETFVMDLTKAPHLLVAGATGQGKSVGLNAVLTSLLYRKHPADLKFVLIDPKKVELTLYSKIERHYLAKLPNTDEAIITDTQKVIHTLQSLTIEMDARYDLLKKAHVRNVKEYNTKFCNRRLNPNNGHRYMPYIVVIIDEFADLIMTAGREIEQPIARIAQLARAVGIHLIIATQRPTTNIITGVIKANFPARIAFRVTSMIDSRTILDQPGANQLIGRGDMLISNGSDTIRVQCAFVDTPEIENITDFIGAQKGYLTALMLPEVVDETGTGDLTDIDMSKRDALFEDAARLVVIQQQGSTSLIQRKFSIGYNRAGRIMDQLEAAGIVGAFEGSKARQVMIQDELSLEHILRSYN